jgi:hypothetical protein
MPVNRDDPGGSQPRYERNRVLGFPVGNGGRPSTGEEPQHVMGMPVDWFESPDPGSLRWLAHPVQAYQRWAKRRRPPEEAEP